MPRCGSGTGPSKCPAGARRCRIDSRMTVCASIETGMSGIEAMQ